VRNRQPRAADVLLEARRVNLLLSDVPLARQALCKLLAGRIKFHPVERHGERGCHLRWTLVTKALLDGNIALTSQGDLHAI